MNFKNRTHAGMLLAERLAEYRGTENTIVLGLPRGGVVVAAEVARKLNLPLDIAVTRKIGAQGNEEFAIGAVDEQGNRYIDETAARMSGSDSAYIERAVKAQTDEALRRLARYRQGRPPPDLHGKTVLLVDDGIATGSTLLSAIDSCRAKSAKRIVAAVPVSAPDSAARVRDRADELVCLSEPEDFMAVCQFYDEFGEVGDEEVMALLGEF